MMLKIIAYPQLFIILSDICIIENRNSASKIDFYVKTLASGLFNIRTPAPLITVLQV